MSEIVDLRGLSIPVQEKPGKDSFDVRPRFVEKWIASLPMANLGETSRLVFKAIVEINRLELGVQDRYKALELFRKPCHYIVESLEKHFAGRPLPLNARNRKISELARALLSELAVGYKIIARQVEATSRPDLKLMSNALHRAMSYEGLLLLRSYQVYAPYPRGTWKELHAMYHFMESYDLLNQVIKDPLNLLPGDSDISALYRKILLLSLAMPYRLHRGEIDKVCTLLNRYVGYSRLERINDPDHPAGLFIVDMDSDTPPGYLAMYNSADYRSCRLLNTSEMVVNLNEQLQAADQELMKIISPDLARRLLSSWSVMSKRSFSRIQKEAAEVEVAFGLSAAHHFISGEQPFSPIPGTNAEDSLFDHPSEFHSSRVEALSDEYKGPDVWNMNYSYSENDPANAPSSTSTLARGNVAGFDYHTSRLGMANVSAGGYCLVSKGNMDFSAHVGDLLAIREVGDSAIEQWGIGVIRRMLSNRGGDIELGIQMMTPNAVAVAARLEGVNGAEAGCDYLRCLMLPELRTIEQPATIITPAMPFKLGSRVRINLQDKSVIAELTQQLEGTRSFSQFEFNVLEEVIPGQEQESSDEDKGDSGEENFDSIWSTL